jgi:hypothetical protein
MSVQEEVSLHAHQIKELFEITSDHEQRIQAMSKEVLLNSFLGQENSRRINETLKINNENKEMIDKLNLEAFSKRTLLDFFSEKLTQPKFLILIGCIILLADTISIVPIAFKHYTGW